MSASCHLPSMHMQATGAAYIAQQFIFESYLDGPEVDVDLALSKGEVIYGAITDNWPTIEPYFNETGSNCPSTLPHQQQVCLGVSAVVLWVQSRAGCNI